MTNDEEMLASMLATVDELIAAAMSLRQKLAATSRSYLEQKFCLRPTIQDESNTNLCTLPKDHPHWFDPEARKHHGEHEHDYEVGRKWGIP